MWAPALDVLERVPFPMIETFDSFKAPDDDHADAAPMALADVDLEQLRGQLAETKGGKRETKGRQKAVAAAATRDDQLRTRNAELTAAVRSLEARLQAEARETGRLVASMERAAEALTEAVRACTHRQANGDGTSISAASNEGRKISTPRPPPAAPADTVNLPKGEAAILTACIQFPDGVERSQLTVLTGYKRSSRDTYIQRLREKGLVATMGQTVGATDEGLMALPDAEPLPTGEALQRHWLDRLPEGERAILQVLIDCWPDEVRREQIDDATGYKRSSRDTYIQRMRARQLLEVSGQGSVRASATLFEK